MLVFANKQDLLGAQPPDEVTNNLLYINFRHSYSLKVKLTLQTNPKMLKDKKIILENDVFHLVMTMGQRKNCESP